MREVQKSKRERYRSNNHGAGSAVVFDPGGDRSAKRAVPIDG